MMEEIIGVKRNKTIGHLTVRKKVKCYDLIMLEVTWKGRRRKREE